MSDGIYIEFVIGGKCCLNIMQWHNSVNVLLAAFLREGKTLFTNQFQVFNEIFSNNSIEKATKQNEPYASDDIKIKFSSAIT